MLKIRLATGFDVSKNKEEFSTVSLTNDQAIRFIENALRRNNYQQNSQWLVSVKSKAKSK